MTECAGSGGSCLSDIAPTLCLDPRRTTPHFGPLRACVDGVAILCEGFRSGTPARQDACMPATMQWSFALIGIAIAGAGLVGAYLPRGDRWAVLLPLVAGAGVGIAVLAFGVSEANQSNNEQMQVFLEASIAGFVTVAGGLVLLTARSNRFE